MKTIPKIGGRLTAFVGVSVHTRFTVPMILINPSLLEKKLLKSKQIVFNQIVCIETYSSGKKTLFRHEFQALIVKYIFHDGVILSWCSKK